MKTFVSMSRKKYSTINDAVHEAEKQKLSIAKIVIHSENGDVLDSIVVSSENGYRYTAYVIFIENNFGDLRWYGTQEQYNCYEEAKAAIIDSAERGIYHIRETLQTTSEYISDEYVEVVMK